ncbi:MAG: lytic transglycosylase domain-containing protein [Pseudomonadota bacterium]
MRQLILGFVMLCAWAASAPFAAAIDLEQARQQGWQVASALELGGSGDWFAAEASVADADPVVRDIVLWRKLRAGEGSLGEYNAYIARRSLWPGQKQLAEVMGQPFFTPRTPGLSGLAADNYGDFRGLYNARKYDEAAVFLDAITGRIDNLGVPSRWADRRRRLARRAAREGLGNLAYRLASQHYLSASDGYAYSDLEWLSGWVALTQLREPGRAAGHFERFSASVETPISLGRAGYWTGRAYEALGDTAQAQKWYRLGASYQTSFYGQLAAVKLGQPGDARLASGALPDWRSNPALKTDDVRMAVIMHYAGQEVLAFATFDAIAKSLSDETALGALGALALELDRPHYAVRIAKAAARKGIVVHPVYYPLHDLAEYATKVEPAFAMSIARQETELNPRAISPAGARGLMQLMPATAKRVAGWIDEEYSRGRLIEDWRYNARLGQTYLSRRTGQFGGSYVMAAAAYNAGAHRVDQWLGDYGDPRLPGATTEDMIDWMENIPFRETRNYVQRVMEGLYVYRARLTGQAGPMTIVQDLARGVR